MESGISNYISQLLPSQIPSLKAILNPIQPVQRACVIQFIVAQPPVSPFLLSFPLAILPLQNSRSVRQLPLGITPASSQLYAQPASPPSGLGNSGYRAAELVAAG